jgi:hypothetical protein
MSLEDRLRHALRRVEPDDDFAARVLARLDAAPRRAPPAYRPASQWALAASVLMAIFMAAGAGVVVQQQRERVRSEAAGRQLVYALELTSRELGNIHQHIGRRAEESGS